MASFPCFVVHPLTSAEEQRPIRGRVCRRCLHLFLDVFHWRSDQVAILASRRAALSHVRPSLGDASDDEREAYHIRITLWVQSGDQDYVVCPMARRAFRGPDDFAGKLRPASIQF